MADEEIGEACEHRDSRQNSSVSVKKTEKKTVRGGGGGNSEFMRMYRDQVDSEVCRCLRTGSRMSELFSNKMM